ncbi:MAG: Cation/multidrug efflux pump [Nevskia sp.]|nr:Cation/multidrug efflux pump [Nevskia sp.]
MSAKSRVFSFAAAAVLLAASASAVAEDGPNASFSSENDATPSSGAILMDVVILRPLSLVGTLLGTAVFVVGLPFELLSGDVSGPANRLVAQPAKFTFTRPLGDTSDH